MCGERRDKHTEKRDIPPKAGRVATLLVASAKSETGGNPTCGINIHKNTRCEINKPTLHRSTKLFQPTELTYFHSGRNSSTICFHKYTLAEEDSPLGGLRNRQQFFITDKKLLKLFLEFRDS